MGFGWSSFGTPYRYSVHHLFQRSPHLRRAGAAAAVFAAMSLLAGCSASQAPVTDTASATPVVGSVSAMGAAQFTQRLAAYERKHNLHIRVDAIDTGNGHHLGWRGEETGPFTMTGLTAAVLVLERASDDELAATVSTASPIAGAAQQQMPDPTLLDAISSALQADDGPAQQALINWLGGESDFRAAATALLRSPDGTMTAESLASVMNAAVYGTATLAPDRRSTLRNLLLNNSAASATASALTRHGKWPPSACGKTPAPSSRSAPSRCPTASTTTQLHSSSRSSSTTPIPLEQRTTLRGKWPNSSHGHCHPPGDTTADGPYPTRSL